MLVNISHKLILAAQYKKKKKLSYWNVYIYISNLEDEKQEDIEKKYCIIYEGKLLV